MRFSLFVGLLGFEVVLLGCAERSTTSTAAAKKEQGVIATTMQSKVTGTGDPLVLVGGGLTGWISWDAHAERLSASRRVVRLQPLNVQWGLENKPLPPDYSVKTEGRAIAAALDQVGLTGALDVVGWSYGGLAALDFALAHQDRIRTLTLIEPPALWVLHALGPLEDDAQKSEASLKTLHGDISEAQLEEFLGVAGFAQPGTSVRDLPQWPVWNRHRQSLRNSVAVVHHVDDLARLKSFARPVLLVKGTGSSRFLHQAIDAMASHFPRAHVVEMPAGHAPHIVSMDRFLDTLAAFQMNGAAPSGHDVSIEDNKVIIRRFLDEVVSKGSTSAADELLASTFVMYPPGSSESIDRDGFIRFAGVFRSAFPDMHDTVEDIVAEGDKVAVRVTVHGTHRGEFQGIAPTGKPISFTGFAIFRLSHGKIAESRALNDRLGLLQQLGAAPSSGQPVR